jgi:hypothetical protein
MPPHHESDHIGPSPAARWLVLGAALLAVLAPVANSLFDGESPGDGAGPQLLITPVGWAFSIWGVIYALALVQAVAVLVVGRGAAGGRFTRFNVDQVGLYVGAAAWIALAGVGSSVATACALAVMAAFAVDGVLQVARSGVGPTWLTVLTRISFGLFAGWVSAAFFLNVGTALAEQDVVDPGSAPWQILLMAVAAATLAGVTLVVGRVVPTYPLAGLWAFFGIWITARDYEPSSVAWVAVAGGVLIALSALFPRAREPR